MKLDRKHDKIFTLGLFAWLQIVEQESDRLSKNAQNALALLREDLERLADDERGE